MYKKIFILILITAFLFTFGCKKSENKNEGKLKGYISIAGAWALYPMTIKWAEEFKKEYPKVKIDISAGGAGKGMTDALTDVVDIGMVSRDIYKDEVEKGAFSISVTKDAVVAVINEKNPILDKILKKGLKKEEFEKIWVTEKIKFWDELLGQKKVNAINLYTRSDACGAAETWAKYLGKKKQEDLRGVGVFGDPGLAEAVKNDTLGIGYNNIGFLYDLKTDKPNQGVKAIPIDVNGNGQIDSDENFYNTKSELVRAIADDKYPSPPARVLFFVTHNKPKKKEVSEFIKWVLTKGQAYVNEAGYIKLSDEMLSEESKKL